MSHRPTITLACQHYDRTTAIVRGLLQPEGYTLRITEWNSVPPMFAAMFRGDYDASEMSLAELIYYTSRDACDFVGIPVFPSRVFRHAFFFVNTAAGITGPGSLPGKRIGFVRWVQTACIWQYGTLVEEYGLAPAATPLFVAAAHHWGERGGDDGREPIVTRDGSVFGRLRRQGGENESAERALIEGAIDVLGTANVPAFFRGGDPRAKRLFENYREVEAAYFRKTRIFPIMHVLVVRKDTVAKYPDLPRALFEVFVRAKHAARDWVRMDPSLGIVWKNAYLEQEREVFGGDPWRYGLDENLHVLSTFLRYCHALGVGARPLAPCDLFHPDTWDLKDV